MSDDLSAVDVAATVVTVRVDTEGGMLARARRVVLPASLLLNCENIPPFLFGDDMNGFLLLRPPEFIIGSMVGDILLTFSFPTAVVALAVDVVLLLLPKRFCLFRG